MAPRAAQVCLFRRWQTCCCPSTTTADATTPPRRPTLQATLLFGATVLYTTLLSGPASLGAGAAGGAGLLLGAGAAAAAWPTVGGIALPVVLFAGVGGGGLEAGVLLLLRPCFCCWAALPSGSGNAALELPGMASSHNLSLLHFNTLFDHF